MAPNSIHVDWNPAIRVEVHYGQVTITASTGTNPELVKAVGEATQGIWRMLAEEMRQNEIHQDEREAAGHVTPEEITP